MDKSIFCNCLRVYNYTYTGCFGSTQNYSYHKKLYLSIRQSTYIYRNDLYISYRQAMLFSRTLIWKFILRTLNYVFIGSLVHTKHAKVIRTEFYLESEQKTLTPSANREKYRKYELSYKMPDSPRFQNKSKYAIVLMPKRDILELEMYDMRRHAGHKITKIG